jgi:hypothetical protein
VWIQPRRFELFVKNEVVEDLRFRFKVDIEGRNERSESLLK